MGRMGNVGMAITVGGQYGLPVFSSFHVQFHTNNCDAEPHIWSCLACTFAYKDLPPLTLRQPLILARLSMAVLYRNFGN